MTEKKNNFEEALEKLENLVTKLESGETDTRERDLIAAMKETDFLGSTEPRLLFGRDDKTLSNIKNNMDLIHA